jgi:hypothetical protein
MRQGPHADFSRRLPEVENQPAEDKVLPFLNPEEAFARVQVELKEHANRGVVMACTAIVDRYLEKLLRLKFSELAPDAKPREASFFLTRRPVPPLGAAAIRARMARLLGIIDKQTCDALLLLIQMRNDFAHQETPPALDLPLVNKIYNAIPTSVKAMLTNSPHPPGYDVLLVSMGTHIVEVQSAAAAAKLHLCTGILMAILAVSEMRLTRNQFAAVLDHSRTVMSKEQIATIEEQLRQMDQGIANSPFNPIRPVQAQTH